MNDGDVEVFLSLVERHRRYLYNLALRITGNEQDAKDVVQDSPLNAFVHLCARVAGGPTWMIRSPTPRSPTPSHRRCPILNVLP